MTTEAEKLEILRVLCGLTAEQMPNSSLTIYLDLAKGIVLNRMYPYAADVSGVDVPEKYAMVQCQIANELVLKHGAEGEVAHVEEGVSRTYENADVSNSLLKKIVPCVHVLTVPFSTEEG